MPELPEVERGRLIASCAAKERTICAVECAPDPIVFDRVNPRIVERTLRGKLVRNVCRHGKQLWFQLERGPHPLFHFGMSGAFHRPTSVPLKLKTGPNEDLGVWPPRFTKIHLRFDDGAELVMTDARRFARILLRERPCQEPPISLLGWDALLALPAATELRGALTNRRGTLKSLLLDQRFLAGLGNWLVDDICYRAKLDPRRTANSLSSRDCARLRRAIKDIVGTAVKLNAQDTEYPPQWLFHRRWKPQNNATTAHGEPIEFITVAGRTTAWVPTRQC